MTQKVECLEKGSNLREPANQPKGLTTKPIVLDRRCELLYLKIYAY